MSLLIERCAGDGKALDCTLIAGHPGVHRPPVATPAPVPRCKGRPGLVCSRVAGHTGPHNWTRSTPPAAAQCGSPSPIDTGIFCSYPPDHPLVTIADPLESTINFSNLAEHGNPEHGSWWTRAPSPATSLPEHAVLKGALLNIMRSHLFSPELPSLSCSCGLMLSYSQYSPNWQTDHLAAVVAHELARRVTRPCVACNSGNPVDCVFKEPC